MTYTEAIPIARELAKRELERKFDVDAFLILALIGADEEITDDVPDIGVDKAFAKWQNSRSCEDLDELLKKIRLITSELYQLCECREERELFYKHNL